MPCDSNLRVKVPATGLVTYPAASVFCKKHIEIHESHRDGFWFLTEAKGLEQELAVKSLGIQLPLAGVYDCLKL